MDYNKPETIVNALNGIDRLFLLTLPTPNMTAIISSLIKEAKKNDVKHIVKLSVLDADAEPGIMIGRYAPTRRKNYRRIWNTLHILTSRCIYAKLYKFFWPNN